MISIVALSLALICAVCDGKTFYVGLSGPWKGFFAMGSHGAGALPVALDVIRHDNITFHEINRGGHEFKYAWTDTECNPSVGISKVADLLYGRGPLRKPIDVLFGPGCSRVCESVGYLAKGTNTPVISYSCYSNLLSDKSIYPTLARTTGPSKFFSPAYVSIIKMFNYTRVAIFSGSESFFDAMTNLIIQDLTSHGILVTDFRTLAGFSSGDRSNSIGDLSIIRERCKGK